MLRVKFYRLKWHQFLLRIPGISGLLIAVDTGRFASTLSILLGSGVPLLESLGISAQVLGNEIIKSQTIEVADSVREGGSLTRALSSSGYFPPMMVYMVSSGEISGELESMLSKAADTAMKGNIRTPNHPTYNLLLVLNKKLVIKPHHVLSMFTSV